MFCLCSFLGVLWCHVLCLVFNHFEFIFVHGVRVCSNFIDLHAVVHLSQQHLLKRLSFSHFMFFPPLLIYFWALYSLPLIHMSVFVPIQHCFDYCSFIVLSEDWECYTSCFVFVPWIALAILGLLWFHINFWIIYSSSVNNVIGNLIEITLNL